MCGIAGFKCFGEARPTREEIDNLLLGIMERGRDATGVAWLENGLKVFKKPIPANQFIKERIYRESIIPSVMLLHARAATQGDTSNNMNNHPIFNKDGMALVHNGVIHNENAIYAARGIKPDAEVDSEVILRLLEKGWWQDIENVNELSGGFACALIWEKRPEELILFRHSNPLAVYMDKDRDILFWASTTNILQNALCKYHRGFMIGKITAYELKDDFAVLVGKDGVIDTKELDPRPYRYAKYTPNYFWGSSWFWGKETKKESKESKKAIKKFCDLCGKFKETTSCWGGDVCDDCIQSLISDSKDDNCPYCKSPLSRHGRCDYCGANWEQNF